MGMSAQEPPSAPAPETGPKPAYTEVDPGKSLDFLGEAVGHSNLQLGLNVLGAYDTNIAAFSNRTQSMTSYLISPIIGLTQNRDKWSLNLNYNGGLGIYQQLPNSDTYSSNASADFLYQLARRWQLHAHDVYTYSADPFGSYYTITGQPQPNYPNPTTYVPFATTNQNMATLDLADQISKYDTLTFTGTESFRRYSNYSGSYNFQVALQNMISYEGGANYSHRFSPRYSAGVGYNFQSMDFSHGQQRSGTSTIQFFGSYQISRSWSLSGWIGPQYISSKTIFQYAPGRYAILLQNDWSAAGGVNVGWQGLRDSFTAGFTKEVSDGGGFLATTVMYSVNGAYRRKLAARWDGTASMQYGHNDSFAASQLSSFFPTRNYTLLLANFSLNREITQRINAVLQYGYIRQTQKNIYLTGTPDYNDNRISISIQYNWNHPLGR
jgi:hypothetical protein